MRINNISSSQNTYRPNFRAKFVINDDFKDFIKIAVKEKPEEIVRLDSALDKLKKVYPDATLKLVKREVNYSEAELKYTKLKSYSYYVIHRVEGSKSLALSTGNNASEVVETIEELSNPSSRAANAVFGHDAKQSLSSYIGTNI